MVSGIGPLQLPQCAGQIALLDQPLGKVFGLILSDLVETHLPLGGKLQRFLIGKVQLHQLILRFALLLRIRKAVRVAFLDPLPVGGTNRLRICTGGQTQYTKGVCTIQNCHLPSGLGICVGLFR